jgi:antibiotic biosynthesis monooxygenase (ABM) superfamily enzyme
VTSGPPRHGRREPTVIVSRRARPGRERELERWLRRLVVRAADAPGYVDAELQPPNDLHPDEWVVVYRFADAAALATWLHSPARQALMATGDDLIDGEAREQVVAMTPASPRVTAVSSVWVKPEQMEAFLDLHAEILVELAATPGFLRADVFEPVPGVQDETVVVLAFDTREHLDVWLRSAERQRILAEMDQHTEGARTVNVVGGFAGWFAPGGGGEVRRWKSAAAVLLALVPVSLAVLAVRLWVAPDLNPVLATVIGNVIGIVVLTWVLMPRITRWLDAWLRR